MFLHLSVCSQERFASRGVCIWGWEDSTQPPPPTNRILRDTPNEWAVRILLECILVRKGNTCPFSREITFTLFAFAFPRCEQSFTALVSYPCCGWKWRGPGTFGTEENSLCAPSCTSSTFSYLHRLSDSKVLTLRSGWKKSHQLLMPALWVACFDHSLFLFDIWNGRGNCNEGCIECWPSLPWHNKSDRNPLWDPIDHKFFPNMNKKPRTIIQSTVEKLIWRFVYTLRNRIRNQYRSRVFRVCRIHIEKLRCRNCPMAWWVWTTPRNLEKLH